MRSPHLSLSLWCEAEVGTWHTRGCHTLTFNPHHRIPIALPSCRDVRALLRATCAGLVRALPLGLIAPAPLHKPLVHDDLNPKCIFAPLYMFPPAFFVSKLWDLSCNPICVQMQQIWREIRGYSLALKITVMVLVNAASYASPFVVLVTNVHLTLRYTLSFPYLGVLIWLLICRWTSSYPGFGSDGLPFEGPRRALISTGRRGILPVI